MTKSAPNMADGVPTQTLNSVCEKTPLFPGLVPEYFPQTSLQHPLSSSRTSFLTRHWCQVLSTSAHDDVGLDS